ncbi:hypothetical protein NQ314_019277 [Rhamnusium bicolor]|uniref:DUF5641 domain-containing protein n=1 Tax=Rhamnusium bicolor TaxID=1586634 RepID=A0AAV8WP46_9CUCU|nr:hypothetical protein NQ314_019277 [Rhamnusium bicolor]
MQHLWSRWSKEYISELQQRVKWKSRTKDLVKPGALVVVKEDNAPPLRWKMGRIVAVHQSKDDVARVATIKIEGGVIKRSFTKICVLPMEVDTSECNSAENQTEYV